MITMKNGFDFLSPILCYLVSKQLLQCSFQQLLNRFLLGSTTGSNLFQ